VERAGTTRGGLIVGLTELHLEPWAICSLTANRNLTSHLTPSASKPYDYYNAMALRVPKPDIENIKKILGLPEERIDEFLRALADAGPHFNVHDLSADVAARTGMESSLAQGITSALASLYITRDSRTTSLEKFLDQDVLVSLKSADVLSNENFDAEWARLRKFFLSALSLDNTVGAVAKAAYVITEHERIFLDARILTDVRPIFHLDVSESPDVAVIVHMLRITQRNSRWGDRKAQYFALDSNDIRTLKRIVDRAIKKEDTLKGVMKNSGVNILAPKATS